MFDILKQLLDFFLHLDVHLAQLTQDYSTVIYLILFLIVFTETGLVIMPFLPGDSLLFAAGALAASGGLEFEYVLLAFFLGAVLGDSTNYWIGDFIGPRVFSRDYRFLKKEYLYKTQAFYQKHGGRTVIFARFIPIIRTFAPFVAGVGTMRYPTFLGYSVFGSVLWVGGVTTIGYLFGNIPAVKNNFGLVVIGIIAISLLPPVIEYFRGKSAKASA
jgi:membrane-associated protein